MKRNHPKDLTGMRFGRLLVEGVAPSRRMGVAAIPRSFWFCLCGCGERKEISRSALVSGDTQSCGCLHLELKRKRLTRHGGAPASGRTKEYQIWQAMIQRCVNASATAYAAYGGRGIKVCSQWQSDFATFIRDMGKAPSAKHSLDRIDGNGDYEPSNCRWDTRLEQNYNRSATVWITHAGRTLPMKEWSRETGINYRTLRNRLISGWPVERALTTTSLTPVRLAHIVQA